MQLADAQRIAAPRDRVYAALNDPDILAQCIPGLETLNKTSDTEMDATVALKVGPVKAKFKGAVTLEDLVPPESYTIVGEGKGGAAGFAKGSAKVKLDDDGDATVLNYQIDVTLGGKIAQLGARLVEGTARKLSGEFFKKFGTLVEQGEEAAEAAPAEAPAAPAEATPTPFYRRPAFLIGAAVIAAVVIYALAA